VFWPGGAMTDTTLSVALAAQPEAALRVHYKVYTETAAVWRFGRTRYASRCARPYLFEPLRSIAPRACFGLSAPYGNAGGPWRIGALPSRLLRRSASRPRHMDRRNCDCLTTKCRPNSAQGVAGLSAHPSHPLSETTTDASVSHVTAAPTARALSQHGDARLSEPADAIPL
jgi:hypothetical protein